MLSANVCLPRGAALMQIKILRSFDDHPMLLPLIIRCRPKSSAGRGDGAGLVCSRPVDEPEFGEQFDHLTWINGGGAPRS